MTYPDVVTVAARVSRQGTTSLTMGYVVTSRTQGEVVAEGLAIVVLFDYQTGSKTAIPEDLRRRIEAVESA